MLFRSVLICISTDLELLVSEIQVIYDISAIKVNPVSSVQFKPFVFFSAASNSLLTADALQSRNYLVLVLLANIHGAANLILIYFNCSEVDSY